MTMFGPYGETRIPPDGSGKRLVSTRTIRINYVSGTVEFLVGDTVRGATSNVSGTVVKIDPRSIVSAGSIFVQVGEGSGTIGAWPTYTLGENLMVNRGAGENLFAQIGPTAPVDATLGDITDLYTSAMSLVSGDNPFNSARVDNAGAILTRFVEGPQQLTAFGETRQAWPEQVAQYTFAYDEDSDPWLLETNGTGSRTHLPDLSAVRLTVGTASGDLARITTDLYHPYQAGMGQMAVMSVFLDTASRTNRLARWGYFDDDDGMFFQVQDDVLSVVRRSSTSGAPVDTVVEQAQWSNDKVDGTGSNSPFNSSGMGIDVSMLNLYWMDMKWLGAGGIRYGVFSDRDGSRLVVHNDVRANRTPAPFMSKSNLPMRVEIQNTGVTSGSSSITMVCGAIFVDGALIPARSRRTRKYTMSIPPVVCPDATLTHIASYRSTATVNAGSNRQISIPELLAVHTTSACRIVLVRNASLAAPSWTHVLRGSAETALDQDVAATATGGEHLISWVLGQGTHNIEFPDNFGILGEKLTRRADGSPGDTFSICAEGLGASATVTVFPTLIDIV